MTGEQIIWTVADGGHDVPVKVIKESPELVLGSRRKREDPRDTELVYVIMHQWSHRIVGKPFADRAKAMKAFNSLVSTLKENGIELQPHYTPANTTHPHAVVLREWTNQYCLSK